MKIFGTLLLGIVFGFGSATAVQSLLDAGARSKARRTAADCRTISTAIEQFRSTTGHYPPLDGDVEHLVPLLVPRYLQNLPTRDMAGQPFLVVMNGSRVAVIATGKYGAVAELGKITRGNVWDGR
jgi:type II secretory pathway pseudopilin PulG